MLRIFREYIFMLLNGAELVPCNSNLSKSNLSLNYFCIHIEELPV